MFQRGRIHWLRGQPFQLASDGLLRFGAGTADCDDLRYRHFAFAFCLARFEVGFPLFVSEREFLKDSATLCRRQQSVVGKRLVLFKIGASIRV